jgi:hypothetical protein
VGLQGAVGRGAGIAVGEVQLAADLLVDLAGGLVHRTIIAAFDR